MDNDASSASLNNSPADLDPVGTRTGDHVQDGALPPASRTLSAPYAAVTTIIFLPIGGLHHVADTLYARWNRFQRKVQGCWIYDRHHEGGYRAVEPRTISSPEKTCSRTASLAPLIRRTTCSTAAKPICQVGCLRVVMPTPASSGPLQLVKAQQANVAPPVQTNALQRPGDLQR
ncbi:Uncharacterised protein [Leclercia adecarboxylata]|uniref:Uncharacterized protein n=1 Tax=Leclercia adecarboxylata TaxID=83655 RepID=A0A4U9HEC0_9ENTR|nr:Uncharacterised protein [Leclercia adecarboxylata]